MKEIFNKSTRNFSSIEKTFSDWDQIRDLVNDQLPKGVKRVEKVRGSETDKSYKVRVIYKSGKSKEIEVPITGKDALGNYNKATRSKVENSTKESLRRYKDNYDQDNISIPRLIQLSSSVRDADRMTAANNINSTPEILEKLSKDDNWRVVSLVARNPKCPREVLERLSKDHSSSKMTDYEILANVASNKNCPRSLINKLISSNNEILLSNIAEYSNDLDTLLLLSRSKFDQVRKSVASNKGCPESILKRLSNDKDPAVRLSTAYNPSTSKSLRTYIANNDEDPRIREAVGGLI